MQGTSLRKQQDLPVTHGICPSLRMRRERRSMYDGLLVLSVCGHLLLGRKRKCHVVPGASSRGQGIF